MIELNKIYTENCLDTMGRMPSEFIDLVVTSPPYDNLRDYNGYEFDFENIAKELFRIVKIGGVVVWVVGDATINGSETGTSFRQALFFKEIGFNLHDTMIYETDKPPVVSGNRYQPAFEYMFIFCKGKIEKFNGIKKKRIRYDNRKSKAFTRSRNGDFKVNKWNQSEEVIYTNVWYFPSSLGGGSQDKISFDHPATFPEDLARDHIYTWSNEFDLVYDPFGGSGTTGKAAHQLKRNWILSEISKEYVELSNKRLYPYLSQMNLF